VQTHPCLTTFRVVPTRSKRPPTCRRNICTQRSPGPAIVLGHLILPPSLQSWGMGEKVRPSSYTTTKFTGPISLACDQYVQYLLVGTNPLILHRHRWGLQPWRCWLSTSLSPPFPSDGPPLSPKGPIRSHVNILKHKPNLKSICVDLQQLSGLRTTKLLSKPITTPSNANNI
jgi:hypothetical protein